MTTQQRIIRAVGVAAFGFVAVIVGTYIRQVLIGGGEYVFSPWEPLVAAVIGAIIGFAAPDAAQRKKNREKLFK